MGELTKNGTAGRVYGGDANLVHIQDGQRATVGAKTATFLDETIRLQSEIGWTTAKLCPGCYMIALFNAAVELARQNGQPLGELGATMAKAFGKLAADPNAGVTEEIEVVLDPC